MSRFSVRRPSDLRWIGLCIFLMACLLGPSLVSAQIPHVVLGQLRNGDNSLPADATTNFKAYLTNRGDVPDTLTKVSAGSSYSSGRWAVTTSNFQGGLYVPLAGDQIRIDFLNTATGFTGSVIGEIDMDQLVQDFGIIYLTGGGAPVSNHVIGTLQGPAGAYIPAQGDVAFQAWLASAPGTIHNLGEAGTEYLDPYPYHRGSWSIDLSLFAGWTTNDTLVVRFVEISTDAWAQVLIPLTLDQIQDYGMVTLLAAVPPVLSGPNVIPTSGFVTTGFVFEVTYTNASNNPPNLVRLNLDGGWYDLTLFSAGADWTAPNVYRSAEIAGLTRTAHSFYFITEDNMALGDTTDLQAGPTVENRLPTVDSGAITPDPAFAGMTLTAPNTTSDADGDVVTVVTEWYVNSILVYTGPELPPTAFTGGDTVQAAITPNDGFGSGTTFNTAILVVSNTIPNEADAVNLTPDPTYETDILTAEPSPAVPVDPDTHDAPFWTYEWTVNGVLQAATGNTLSSVFVAGDVVVVNVRGCDEEACSDPVTATRTITNRLPSMATEITVAPATPTTDDPLVASVLPLVPTDDDPSQTPFWTYLWYRNDVATAYTEATLPASATVHGESWSCGVRAYDGMDYSAELRSLPVTILNRAPAPAISVTLDPSAPHPGVAIGSIVDPTTPTDLDPEDAPYWTYLWYRDGVATSYTEATLPAGVTVHGEIWSLGVRAFDGELYSEEVFSAPVNVLDLAPNPPTSVRLDPILTIPGATIATIVEPILPTDPNPEDTPIWMYSWVINGVPVGISSAILPAGITVDGDRVVCGVWSWDGDLSSEVVWSDTAVVRGNHPPYPADGVNILPEWPMANTELTAIVTPESPSDPDGDPTVWAYTWYRDGVLLSSTTNTLGASEVLPGTTIRVVVTAFDGREYSSAVSDEVLIPTDYWLADGMVTPGTGAYETDFTYSVVYSSFTNTPPSMVVLVVDGSAYHQMTRLNPSDDDYTDGAIFVYHIDHLDVGTHLFRFRAMIDDLNAGGDIDTHTGPVVENILPTLESVVLNPLDPTVLNTLTTTALGYADLEGTVGYYHFEWLVNDVSIATSQGWSNEASISSGYRRGDVVRCVVTVEDGNGGFSAPMSSNSVTILNSVPQTPDVVIIPAEPTNDDVLRASVRNRTETDADGNLLAWFYTWFRNDTLQPSMTDSLIPPVRTETGDVWRVEVQSWDGTVLSAIGADTVVIDSTFARVTAASVTPTTGGRTQTFTYRVTYTHPGGFAPLDLAVLIDDAISVPLVPLTTTWAAGAVCTAAVTDLAVGMHTWRVTGTDDHGRILMGNLGPFTGPNVVNLPPEQAAFELHQYAVVGVPYTMNLAYFDQDGDALVFTLVDGPVGMTVGGRTGLVTWADPTALADPYPCLVTVSDGFDAVTFAWDLYTLDGSNAWLIPPDLSAENGFVGSVPVHWSAPELMGQPEWPIYLNEWVSIVGYDLIRTESGDTVHYDGLPITRYNDIDVVSGTTYGYRVRTEWLGSNGFAFVSDWSDIDFGTPLATGSTIQSTYLTHPAPAIDGVLAPAEWTGATVVGIAPQVQLYVQNDDRMLYFGIVDQADPMLEEFDQIAISFDDNTNRLWDVDNLEGVVWLVQRTVGLDGEVVWQQTWGTWPDAIEHGEQVAYPGTASGAVAQGTGSVNYEFAMRWDSPTSPFFPTDGRTTGFRIYVHNATQASDVFDAVWPTGSELNDPASFGTLILGDGNGRPIFDVAPLSLSMVLQEGDSGSLTLDLSNLDGGIVGWQVSELTDMPTFFGRPGIDLPSSHTMQRHRVLIYSDEPTSINPVSFVAQGAEAIGIGYTLVDADPARFIAQLADGPWDLVVVSNVWLESPELWTPISNYLAAGGKVAISTFNLNSTEGADLWSLAGVAYDSRLTGNTGVGPTDPLHTLFTMPGPVYHQPAMNQRGFYMVLGSHIRALGDAGVMMRFDDAPYPGNGALVLNPTVAGGGEALVASFIVSALEADVDADGTIDGIEYWRNIIAYMLGVEDVPWLTENPTSGVIGPNGSTSVTVGFDATELLSLHTYTAWLQLDNSAGDAVFVPCTLRVTPTPSVSLDFSLPVTPTGCPGDTVLVPLTLDQLNIGSLGINSLDFTLTNDSAVVHPIEVYTGSATGEWLLALTDIGPTGLTVHLTGDALVRGGEVLRILYWVNDRAYAGNFTDLGLGSVVIGSESGIATRIRKHNGVFKVRNCAEAWTANLFFTDQNIRLDELSFGLTDGATNGWDEGLDLVDTSHTSPGTMDAYFDILDPSHPRLMRDYRGLEGDSIVWTIVTRYQQGQMRWDLSNLPPGNFYINNSINMRLTDVFEFGLGDTIHISFFAGCEIPFELALRRGWNMISVPVNPVQDSIDAIWPDNLGLFNYNPESRRYDPVERVAPGKAYYLLSMRDTTIEIRGCPVLRMDLPLRMGWNQVGAPYVPLGLDVTIPDVNPPSAIAGQFFYYDASHVPGAYRASDTLYAGVGYFVLSMTTATLHLEAGIAKSGVRPTVTPTWETGLNLGGTVLTIGAADMKVTNYLPPPVPGVTEVAPFLHSGLEFAPQASSMLLTSDNGTWTLVVPGETDLPVRLEPSGNAPRLEISDNHGLRAELNTVALLRPGTYTITALPYAGLGVTVSPSPVKDRALFDLSALSGEMRLSLYAIDGSRLLTVDRVNAPGQVTWDGADAAGHAVPAGIYLLEVTPLETGNPIRVRFAVER